MLAVISARIAKRVAHAPKDVIAEKARAIGIDQLAIHAPNGDPSKLPATLDTIPITPL